MCKVFSYSRSSVSYILKVPLHELNYEAYAETIKDLLDETDRLPESPYTCHLVLFSPRSEYHSFQFQAEIDPFSELAEVLAKGVGQSLDPYVLADVAKGRVPRSGDFDHFYLVLKDVWYYNSDEIKVKILADTEILKKEEPEETPIDPYFM